MIDVSKIDDLTVEGIDFNDAPDFSDAYVDWAEYEDGTELTEAELEELNSDSDWLFSVVQDWVQGLV